MSKATKAEQPSSNKTDSILDKSNRVKFILRESDGQNMVVAGRQPTSKTDPTKVFWDMAKIPLGARVAFIYEEDRENETANPTKIIAIGYEGQVDKEKYLNFKAKYNLSELVDEDEEAPEEEEVLEPEVVEEI